MRELIAQNPADVALVTVMWANNEVGTVQPIQEIADIASEYGIPMHTDAVQAFGAVPVNFRDSGVDTMAISGHKIGGPMGIGALIATRAAQLTPVLHGGGQERSVRSGTIDAPRSRDLPRPSRTWLSILTKNPPVLQHFEMN